MPIPALIAAGASLVGGTMDQIFGRSNAHLNYRQQRDLLREEQRYQDSLNANSAMLQKVSMKNAGLNINWSDGAAPVNLQSNVPSAPGSPQSPNFDLSSVAQLLLQGSQKKALDAQAKKTSAEADALEIENQRKRDEDEYFAHPTVEYSRGDTPEDFEKISENAPVTSYGAHAARTKLNALNIQNNDVRENLHKVAYNISKYNLDKKVVDLQFQNQHVIEALENLPHSQYAQLEQLIKNLGVEHDLLNKDLTLKDQDITYNDLVQKITNWEFEDAKNSNFRRLFTEIAKGEHTDWKVVAAAVLGALLDKFSGSISIRNKR